MTTPREHRILEERWNADRNPDGTVTRYHCTRLGTRMVIAWSGGPQGDWSYEVAGDKAFFRSKSIGLDHAVAECEAFYRFLHTDKSLHDVALADEVDPPPPLSKEAREILTIVDQTDDDGVRVLRIRLRLEQLVQDVAREVRESSKRPEPQARTFPRPGGYTRPPSMPHPVPTTPARPVPPAPDARPHLRYASSLMQALDGRQIDPLIVAFLDRLGGIALSAALDWGDAVRKAIGAKNTPEHDGLASKARILGLEMQELAVALADRIRPK